MEAKTQTMETAPTPADTQETSEYSIKCLDFTSKEIL